MIFVLAIIVEPNNITAMMISKADQALLNKKGISVDKFAEQLKTFKTGFPFLKIEDAAFRCGLSVEEFGEQM